MSVLTIQVDNHNQPFTVREMRRRLAQVLSKLNGDMQVSFSFSARLENYQPFPPANSESCNPMGEPFPPAGRVATEGYSLEWEEDKKPSIPGAVYGELARPEND